MTATKNLAAYTSYNSVDLLCARRRSRIRGGLILQVQLVDVNKLMPLRFSRKQNVDLPCEVIPVESLQGWLNGVKTLKARGTENTKDGLLKRFSIQLASPVECFNFSASSSVTKESS